MLKCGHWMSVRVYYGPYSTSLDLHVERMVHNVVRLEGGTPDTLSNQIFESYLVRGSDLQ